MTATAETHHDSSFSSGYFTHHVLNQPGALADYNAFSADKPLVEAMRTFGADWARDKLDRAGALVGSEKIQHLARQANRHLPELKTHDRFGNRVDWVDFHPSWHQLMSLAWKHEVPNLAWRTNQKNGHYARAVLSYVWNQIESGTACPTG